jgi:hypothetical protein
MLPQWQTFPTTPTVSLPPGPPKKLKCPGTHSQKPRSPRCHYSYNYDALAVSYPYAYEHCMERHKAIIGETFFTP